ncbi:molybdopterin-dependent oxidoreductase [Actinoplanes sp. NPDC026619]|uniref:molybdopterin-dependent oxidoreductase n=1 Tax=Actinoplanes sp. NPDC026619 TaxID=3155798 RepID=UPI0033EBCA72
MQSTRSWRMGAVAAVLLLAACSSGSSGTQAAAPGPATPSAARVISVATLKPGQTVPTPAGKALFTMTGKISTSNKGADLVFDQSTVEDLGLVQVKLYEPWTKADMEFRGVWLKDLVAVAGVPADATRLHITALDDYAVDLSLADIRAGGIMLATRAGDGSAIPIDQGGPSRVVFSDGVKAGTNADQWVWSVKEIAVQ